MKLILCLGGVALIAAAAVNAQEKCPFDWTYNPGSNKCYKLFEEYIMWNQANLICILYHQGHQVSVHSSSENQFLRDIANRWGSPIWLGFSFDKDKNGRMWSDHSETTYTNWKDGITPVYNKYKQCTKLELDGQWIEHCCQSPMAAYVCERKANVRAV